MHNLARGVLRLLSVRPRLCHVSTACASYKAVIFDMFGVLIPSPLPKAAEWEDKNGVPRGTIGRAIQTGGESWRKYMKGQLGPEEFVEAFSRDCSRLLGFEVHIGSFHAALTADSMSQPLPLMLETVQCVRAEGLKTAVLSNNFFLPGGKSFMPLDRSLFDVIVESCREGLCKPDPRIFQLCAERLGVSPQEAVFLDDLSFNVEAAKQVGMRGITVRDPASAVKELEQVLEVPLSGFVPGTRSVSSSHKLPMDKLTQYLHESVQFPNTEPIEVRQFSHSQFDSTFLLSCAGHHLVLKKKPNLEALRKECRLLGALKEYGLPVPEVLAQCEKSSVLDAPFFLMSYCRGHLFNNPLLPELDTEKKRRVYEAIIRTLCQIHRVDLKSTELEYLREPDFMEGQVQKWTQCYKASETRSIPAMDRLSEWLLLHCPKEQRTTLVHGDFRLDNLVFDLDKPEFQTVLGWSFSAIGDPFMDVASLCMPLYVSPTSATKPGSKPALMALEHSEELFELYSREMGLDNIPNWRFYVTFCLFRDTAVLQANYKSSRKDQGEGSASIIEDMAELAWDFATKEGFRIFNAMPRAAGV